MANLQQKKFLRRLVALRLRKSNEAELAYR
jgi:hypothetical protein